MGKAILYVVILCVVVIFVLDRADKANKKRKKKIESAGMKSDTVLEIGEMNVPDSNPNAPNDIYQPGSYYAHCWNRKKIIAGGTPYPGIITEVEAVLNTRKNGYKVPEYTVAIRYGERKGMCLQYVALEEDPRVVLENPYCTVYEYNKKRIATDFKVKECYINENGKFKGEAYLGLQREERNK